MKLAVRQAALADLERIHAWIAADSPANAQSVVTRIAAAIENRIACFPGAGRLGAVPGTREWIVRGLPYIIVYQVDAARDLVTVLAIFHAAQNR